MKKTIKIFTCTLAAALTAVFSFQIYYMNELPDSYKIRKGEQFTVSGGLTVSKAGGSGAESAAGNIGSQKVSLNMLGVIPIKNVLVTEIDDYEVCVGGNIFGIKIFTKGVMVVGISAVETADGEKNPAGDAGIKLGDNILSIGGESVSSNEDVARIIQTGKGCALEVIISRSGKQKQLKLLPALSKDGDYKAGMWVRDSSAGIGTMTFYDPVSRVYAGLGHAICDIDTGEILPLQDGEIVSANILSINKSRNGKSGSLCGEFSGGRIGSLNENNELGVYGVLDSDLNAGHIMKIALKQQIKEGGAQIYTSIDNNGPQLYDCKIVKIKYNGNDTHNMVIEITDDRLLEQTGGIVQGMSGSPLIQDGQLIGAVTHVFVNDTAKGYAIFAENMYETAQSVAKEQKSKKAS